MMQSANLYGSFAAQVTAHADKELLQTVDGASFSYADIDSGAARLARCLSESGVRPSDRVSVQVEKSPQALCLYLACLRGGFVFHPLNTAYRDQELDYFMRDAEPTAVVCDPGREAFYRKIADDVNIAAVFTLDAAGAGSLSDASGDMEADFGIEASAPDDVAALLYSSGTTGVPKGIMLTHRNLVSNTESLVSAWGFSAGDRLLHALPIFHVHGLFVAIGCVMMSGASMRWLAKFDARDAIRYLDECSVMMGVPTYYTRLLAEPDFGANSCRMVRVFISGSAPLLAETFHEFEKRTGHRILERYGMTETNMNTSNPLHGQRKPGTVGPPLPGVEVRITDDTGHSVPSGEIGNLQVRGPNVFVGYWKLPDKTAEDIDVDGWFNTGDKGTIDEDGYVSIVGRSKDVVISGGLNVYPKEVEQFIDDLEGVSESAIIGVPHPDFGEAVVAIVVAATKSDQDADSIVAACKTSLANFKVPKKVIFVDQLPRNTMSKVQKNVMRDTYRDIFASEAG
jgi:malonyl-CoA/methylmalonyl-CoA synthetase